MAADPVRGRWAFGRGLGRGKGNGGPEPAVELVTSGSSYRALMAATIGGMTSKRSPTMP
jgi:hypothetical protein